MTLPLPGSLKAASIIVGGGCFWCLDASYRLLDGVTAVTSGYAGGKEQNPTYEQVCSAATGHAEVVKVEFDPARVTLEQVLELFWHMHDPTQVGGQGHDMGPQYRSIIVPADEAQKAAAEKSRMKAQVDFDAPITTEIVPLTTFWPAEDYHQDYFAKHPERGYCAAVVRPKVDKIKRLLGPDKRL